MNNAETGAPRAGAGIFDLVTTGMYRNPLDIYREYIQNTADAVGPEGAGSVRIDIDPNAASISIRDDGPGLTAHEAEAALIPIAHSRKRRGRDRGFRGIGRLSALGFAESVTFRTRTKASAPVAEVVWHAPSVRNRISETGNVSQAISDCVRVETLSVDDDRDHFFDVLVEGISRQTANRLLNRDAVRRYLAQTCPVPLPDTFPFASAISDFLRDHTALLALHVTINEDPAPVMRPHGGQIVFSDDKIADFTELETVLVPAVDGEATAAVGWMAHSSYLGAIPRDTDVGGMRAREGNLQIGDRDIFAHLFSESRFNGWCVGDIHILDARITPNNRRDYFELNPHLRNLENHLSARFHRISSRCRKASSDRNAQRRLAAVIQESKDAYALAASGFLPPEDTDELVEESLEKLMAALERVPRTNRGADRKPDDLLAAETKLRNFPNGRRQQPFRGVQKSRIDTYQRIFRALHRSCDSPRTTLELIEAVMQEYE